MKPFLKFNTLDFMFSLVFVLYTVWFVLALHLNLSIYPIILGLIVWTILAFLNSEKYFNFGRLLFILSVSYFPFLIFFQ